MVNESKELLLTTSAAKKVFELMQEEQNKDLKLRIFIVGGGCSGLQYGFTFDENINSDDIAITKQSNIASSEGKNEGHGIMLLIDAISYQYLAGAEVDYVEDLGSSRFVIRNPNVKTTCSCGESFSV